jgi:hypothetical protein
MSRIDLSRFDYETYSAILQELGDGRQNLRLCDTRDVDLSEPYFILRHDVDFCPDAALDLAEFEYNLGIRATYFLMFNSPCYNLLAPRHLNFARKLVELDHEVGFHYDVPSMETFVDQLTHAAIMGQYTAMLASLSGKPVVSVTMHNPSLLGKKDPFSSLDYIYASDPKFTLDITYLSDSCGAWRDEADELFRRGKLPEKIQILFHPIFWGANHRSRDVRLDQLILRLQERLEIVRSETKHIWSRHDGLREHEARLEGKSLGYSEIPTGLDEADRSA